MEKNNKKNDIIELIEDSLGGISGGLSYNYTNIDNTQHFGTHKDSQSFLEINSIKHNFNEKKPRN